MQFYLNYSFEISNKKYFKAISYKEHRNRSEKISKNINLIQLSLILHTEIIFNNFPGRKKIMF